MNSYSRIYNILVEDKKIRKEIDDLRELAAKQRAAGRSGVAIQTLNRVEKLQRSIMSPAERRYRGRGRDK